MTAKEALWRELRYQLAGTGGDLDGIVDQDHILMDVRPEPPKLKNGDDYPWIIFSRPVRTEQSDIKKTRDRFDLEIIGLQGTDGKDDDLVEQIADILQDHFQGKHKTFGKFTATGVADPNGGLKLDITYVNTTDAFGEDLEEKIQIMQFAFHYVRA